MSWIRHNFAYILLTVVAILLIFLTVQLQTLLLNAQPVDQPAIVQAATAIPLSTPLQLLPTPIAVAPTPLPVSNPSAALPAVSGLASTQATIAQVEGLSPEEQLEIDMLSATNLTTSEEDTILVDLIKTNANAVGFIRYSSYLANQETLRAVKIEVSSDGTTVEPNEDTVASGAYPFSRPLLLYAATADMKAKPALEGYIGCYLNRIFTEIELVGYTPPSLAMYRDALDSFKATCQHCQMAGSSNPLFPVVPACSAEGFTPAALDMTGGSTVYPLSARMIEIYKEVGFTGDITLEDIGTSSGFERFCEKGEADLVNASRLVKEKEQALCRANNRELIAFPVGLDLVVVVVSRQNTFVEQLSFVQLQQLFTNALRWSEIDPTWPVESITRAIPNKSRGTFTFFTEMLYAGVSTAPVELAPAPAAAPAKSNITMIVSESPTTANSSPPATAAIELAPATTAETTAPPSPVDFRLGYLDRDDCPLTTALVQSLLEEMNYKVEQVAFNSPTDLFAALTSSTRQNRIDWTMCYVTPTDQTRLEQERALLSVVGESYYQRDSKSYAVLSSIAMKRVLQQESPCVYKFLQNFALDELNTASLSSWKEEHQALVQTWTSCR